MREEWRKKCEVGCTCGKHRPRPCAPGCTCSRHSAEWKKRKCPEGCTCSRHKGTFCEPGCTCDRHKDPHNKQTPEQRAAAVEHRRARVREYMREARKQDPKRFPNRATPERKCEYTRKYRHGVSPTLWDEMLAEQDGCCYLCGISLVVGRIHVDHDHSCCPGTKACGRCVRGLACPQCNQGIGQFGDDPERMRRAADALELANRRVRAPA